MLTICLKRLRCEKTRRFYFRDRTLRGFMWGILLEEDASDFEAEGKTEKHHEADDQR